MWKVTAFPFLWMHKHRIYMFRIKMYGFYYGQRQTHLFIYYLPS